MLSIFSCREKNHQRKTVVLFFPSQEAHKRGMALYWTTNKLANVGLQAWLSKLSTDFTCRPEVTNNTWTSFLGKTLRKAPRSSRFVNHMLLPWSRPHGPESFFLPASRRRSFQRRPAWTQLDSVTVEGAKISALLNIYSMDSVVGFPIFIWPGSYCSMYTESCCSKMCMRTLHVEPVSC